MGGEHVCADDSDFTAGAILMPATGRLRHSLALQALACVLLLAKRIPKRRYSRRSDCLIR